jgi:hypothetical protein
MRCSNATPNRTMPLRIPEDLQRLLWQGKVNCSAELAAFADSAEPRSGYSPPVKTL